MFSPGDSRDRSAQEVHGQPLLLLRIDHRINKMLAALFIRDGVNMLNPGEVLVACKQDTSDRINKQTLRRGYSQVMEEFIVVK